MHGTVLLAAALVWVGPGPARVLARAKGAATAPARPKLGAVAKDLRLGDDAPQWSPDGQWLVVASAAKGLCRIRASDGQVTVINPIKPDPPFPGLPKTATTARALAPIVVGDRVIYQMGMTFAKPHRLRLVYLTVPLAGGAKPVKLFDVDVRAMQLLDARLRDKRAEFLFQGRKGRQCTLWIRRGADGKTQKHCDLPHGLRPIGVSGDWRLVAVRNAMPIGPDSVRILQTDGSTVAELPAEVGALSAAISPDRNYVAAAYLKDNKDLRLAVVPLRRPDHVRVLHSGAESYGKACWSPDGRRLAVAIALRGHRDALLILETASVKRPGDAPPRPATRPTATSKAATKPTTQPTTQAETLSVPELHKRYRAAYDRLMKVVVRAPESAKAKEAFREYRRWKARYEAAAKGSEK